MSEEAHASAVMAALTSLQAHPFDLDDVPTTRPVYYNEVVVYRRFGGLMRGGIAGTELYRVSIRSVAKTVSNAREMRRRASLLEGTVLTVGGIESTPIQFETADLIAEDSGWYTGLADFTYAV